MRAGAGERLIGRWVLRERWGWVRARPCKAGGKAVCAVPLNGETTVTDPQGYGARSFRDIPCGCSVGRLDYDRRGRCCSPMTAISPPGWPPQYEVERATLPACLMASRRKMQWLRSGIQVDGRPRPPAVVLCRMRLCRPADYYPRGASAGAPHGGGGWAAYCALSAWPMARRNGAKCSAASGELTADARCHDSVDTIGQSNQKNVEDDMKLSVVPLLNSCRWTRHLPLKTQVQAVEAAAAFPKGAVTPAVLLKDEALRLFRTPPPQG